MRPEQDVFAGIDVGGTKIAGVVYADDGPATPVGEPLARAQIPARCGADALLDDVSGLLAELQAQLDAGGHGSSRLAGIGIGTPGCVDRADGSVDNIANLGIGHVELGGQIARRAGVPVTVENDVNAAALGAHALLAARGTGEGDECGTTVFLNIGTGLAAGVLRFGALDHGAHGNVGEIGHIPVEPHRLPCACGQRGCLETVASGGALAHLWPYDDPPMPALIRRARDPADPRHDQAARLLKAVIAALADALTALAVTVDPDTIIIGGGVARTGEPLLREIRDELSRRERSSAFLQSMELGQRLMLAPMDMPVGAIGAGVAAQAAQPR